MSDRNPNKRGGPDILGDILKDTPFAHKSEIERREAALEDLAEIADEWEQSGKYIERHGGQDNPATLFRCTDQLRAILKKHGLEGGE